MEPAAGALPLNEVVLSISFDEQEMLAGPKLLVAIQKLLSAYPDFEEQWPFEMREELPLKAELLKPAARSLQIVGPMGPTAKRRYWLTAKEDKAVLVQVQSDYFALNWRARSDGCPYPGFPEMKELFFKTFDAFRSTIAEAGVGNPEVQQVELSYINVIKPSGDYVDHSFVNKVLNVQTPAFADAEQLNINISRSLVSPDGAFFGRSYTHVQTGYQLVDSSSGPSFALTDDLDLRPVLNLNTSVRSAKHKSLSLDEISDAFSREHDEATRSFRSITTESAHAAWGLK